MCSLKQYHFSEWQSQPIFMKKYGEVSIKFMLQNFIDSLVEFLHKNGYNIYVSANVLGDTIASTLYKLDYNRFYILPIPNNIKYDEYYNHFEYVINWNDFWKVWNDNTFNFFEEAELQIIHIIWSYINLDTSEAHMKYVELMEGYDSEDDTPKKIKNLDPYLLDQLNASNHYKFTRFDNS